MPGQMREVTRCEEMRPAAADSEEEEALLMKFCSMSVWMMSAAILLAGCGVSSTNYAASREALKGSPGVRSDFVNTCTRNISRKPLATRQAIAKVMNVSVKNTPRTYCSRLTRGITSGRLSHADINAASRGQVTPAIIRVLQGR
ncbi:MAG: hypothetical protein WBA88_11870 [Pseudaminobacter sp.]